MAHDENKPSANVQLDLDNEVFQQGWFRLEKEEQQRVLDTLNKISQLTWSQVYHDTGLAIPHGRAGPRCDLQEEMTRCGRSGRVADTQIG